MTRWGLLAAGLSVTVAAPVLAGQVGLEAWRARPPRWQMTSTRSLVDLEGCLGSKWAGTQHTQMLMMPIEHGMSWQNNGHPRNLLVDLTDDGDHRTIKLWLRVYMGITVGAKEQIAKLGRCADPSRPSDADYDTAH